MTEREEFWGMRQWRAGKIKAIASDFAAARVPADQIVRKLRFLAREIEDVAPRDPTEPPIRRRT